MNIRLLIAFSVMYVAISVCAQGTGGSGAGGTDNPQSVTNGLASTGYVNTAVGGYVATNANITLSAGKYISLYDGSATNCSLRWNGATNGIFAADSGALCFVYQGVTNMYFTAGGGVFFNQPRPLASGSSLGTSAQRFGGLGVLDGYISNLVIDGSINMSGKAITNLLNAVNAQDAVTFTQLQAATNGIAGGSGLTNAVSIGTGTSTVYGVGSLIVTNKSLLPGANVTISDDGAGTLTIASTASGSSGVTGQYMRWNGFAAYGTDAAGKVVRYSTLITNSMSASATWATNAADGMTVTILADGNYEIGFVGDSPLGGTSVRAVMLNSTNHYSADMPSALTHVYSPTVTGVEFEYAASVSTCLSSNDIIRITGVGTPNSATLEQFWMRRSQ